MGSYALNRLGRGLEVLAKKNPYRNTRGQKSGERLFVSFKEVLPLLRGKAPNPF